VKIGTRGQVFQLKGWKRGKYVFDSCLKRAAEIGFDGIELCSQHPLSDWMTKYDIIRVKKDAEKYGVEIATLCISWAWRYAAFHKRLSEWKKCSNGLRFMKNDIRLASLLGAKAVLIHFGASRGTYEEAKETLSELAEEAEKYKVKIGYESNIWRGMGIGDLDVYKKIVEEINSEYLGFYIHYTDEYLLRLRGKTPTMTPEKEFEMAGKKLVCIHSSGIYPESKIDYESLLTTIKKYYDWYWIFEAKDVERHKKAMDELLAKYW